MEQNGNGGTSEGFEELFGVIESYAGGDHDHQVKALQTMAGTYSPLFDMPVMPDAKALLEGLLEGHDYLIASPSGGIETASVDAVVSVATARFDDADMKWGADLLLHMMESLGRRAREEGYETYVIDAQIVLDGLETLLAVDVAEDLVNDGLE